MPTDGLFRVWYQYRKGKGRLEPLIRFMAFWYEPDALQGAVARLLSAVAAKEAPHLERDSAQAALRNNKEEAIRCYKNALGSLPSKLSVEEERSAFWIGVGLVQSYVHLGRWRDALDQSLTTCNRFREHADEKARVAMSGHILNIVSLLAQQNEYDEALRVCSMGLELLAKDSGQAVRAQEIDRHIMFTTWMEIMGPDPAQWSTDESSEGYRRMLGLVPPESQQIVKDIVGRIISASKSRLASAGTGAT